jgi:hypothetical protein
MKVSTKNKTFWEVCDSKSNCLNSEMGRPREYGGSGEDFRDEIEAAEFAREVDFKWVREIAYAIDDEGINYERVCFERFHRVQPSVITAHARCCRCGQAETFRDGVLAFDWKFEHEVMHNFLRCVDAWESDLAHPGKTFPLRKRVPVSNRIVLMPITSEPEPDPSAAVMSDGKDED